MRQDHLCTHSSALARLYGLLLLGLALMLSSNVSAQSTVYEERFDNGLGSFSAVGRVDTGSYGVRLRGGGAIASTITSSAISTSGYSNLSLSYDREASGLSLGESFTVSYSVNGGAWVNLESTRRASGRATHSLPASASNSSLRLRVTIDGNTLFDSVTVDNIVITGSGGGNGGDPDPDPGNGTLPPVSRIDTNGPFQTTQHRNVGSRNNGWVVHPSNLGANGLRHPIFIWGPGAGTGPSNYDFFMDRIASHGFVVYSEVSTGDGSEMTAALNWLIAENNRPGSRYYQKLDTTKIAFGGHSRGSLSAFGVANDSRLTTTVHVAGGSFDGRGPNSLRKPTIYIAGENDSLATSNMERDYRNTNVPVFFTIIDGVNHTQAAREGMPAIVAWLRWHLGGESFRSGAFLDTRCDFCVGRYDSESKNW